MTATKTRGRVTTDVEKALDKLERLKLDPRFAIENLYVVWDQAMRKMVPFRFNEAQLLLERERTWFKHQNLPVRLWVCKSRRAGVSTGCEGYLYQDTTHNENTNSLILANHSKPAENVLNMCRTFWKHTPEDLRPTLPSEYRGQPPKDRMEFPKLNSKLFVATAKSLEQYLGYGFQNLHATEVARYKEGKDLFVALFPTLTQDPHSMFYGESTPLGQGNFFHEQCMEAFENRGRITAGSFGMFRLLFIPWHSMVKSYSLPFDEPEQRKRFELSLTANEKDLLHRFPQITLEQLKWRRGMLAGPPFNRDEDLFDQEYPTDLETAFLQTGTSAFSRSIIKRLAAAKKHPIWKGDIHWGDSDVKNEREREYDLVRRPCVLSKGDAQFRGFRPNDIGRNPESLVVFRWPEKGDRIVIACDVASGDPETRNGDFSTIQVLAEHDFAPNEQLMRWRGRCNEITFAIVCSALAWYIAYRTKEPLPLLVIEWTGPGTATNTYLDHAKLYPRTFRYFNPGVRGQPKTNHIGWESNYKTKRLAITAMQFMLENADLEIFDQDTLAEMTGFRAYGALGAEEYGGEGMHDDLVIAMAIGCACMRLNLLGSAAVEPEDLTEYTSQDDDHYDSFDPLDEAEPDDDDDGDILTNYAMDDVLQILTDEGEESDIGL